MARRLISLLLALAALAPLSSMACNIIYGSDWAFLSKEPAGWKAACGDNAMDGTALTLWPADQNPSEVSVAIYVTVSDKGTDTLSSFVVDEVARFRKEAPEPSLMSLGPILDVSPTRKMVHVGNSVGGRDELVEYIEGPTAYYIVVLTTESPAATERYRGAFDSFLESFTPSTVTKGGG